RRVALGCKGERELLAAQPRVVLAKLRDIRPIFYWRYLGERGPGGDYQYWRLIESFKWRSRRLLSKLNAPVLLLTHFETKADKIIHGICEQLPAANSPWFLYSHLMDVHDCASASRLGHFLGRLRFFPTWLVARLSGKTKRRAIYDMALMYVDRKLGLLLKHLEASGVLDDTVLLVTGDHGSAYAGTTHAGLDIGERTHVEHIEVPLIVAGVDRQPSAEGIVDTMGIASTLLDALDVPKHASFLGCSAFARGPVAVITETAGRGNADVERRDLYFTVTTAQYRMMSVLKQAQLHVLHLFDRIADPEEANDLARREEQRASINTLIGHLFTERGALLAERGVDATAPPLTPPPLAS
ncbi:MAG: sulfatase-like hydrolase/transferase, partial [Chromatiales bacterium]|nr:sulfatase-like hydrolase/transferase [Chromatiales bacterium]